MKTALVLGGGGFVGSHLVKRLKSEGYWVRAVDLKYPEFSKSEADEMLIYDLRHEDNVAAVMRTAINFSYHLAPYEVLKPFDEVYQLAADMGGAGFVFTGENDADIMHNSAVINLHVAKYAVKYGIGKLFYSSSACMYPQEIQNEYQNSGLREYDAYPANPDSEYGWEKLFSERLFLAFAKNKKLNVKIARFHNIYGPEGTYQGGREKAPAAMCRKVIEQCGLDDSYIDDRSVDRIIEVWGTGHQTRSFLYIDDCIDAVRLLMESDFSGPVNIGSEEIVTINQLAQMAIEMSGKDIAIKNIPGPVGVMGRNSNNDLIREKLGWSPKWSLFMGLARTYKWIESNYTKQ